MKFAEGDESTAIGINDRSHPLLSRFVPRPPVTLVT
jgi:SAM-dependent methyltransferase